jgi:hypothetical protein
LTILFYSNLFFVFFKFVDFETWSRKILAKEEAEQRKQAQAAAAAVVTSSRISGVNDDRSDMRSSTTPAELHQQQQQQQPAPLPRLTCPHTIHDQFDNTIEFTGPALPRITFKQVRVDNMMIYGEETKRDFSLLTVILIDQTHYVHPTEFAHLIGLHEANLHALMKYCYSHLYNGCWQRFRANKLTFGLFNNVLKHVSEEAMVNETIDEVDLLVYNNMNDLLKCLTEPKMKARIKGFLRVACKIKPYTGDLKEK